MYMTGKALIGALVLGATGLAFADGVEWAANGSRGNLVPGGVAGTQTLNVCRATIGSTVVVGKVASDRSGVCQAALGGQPRTATQFDVLAVSQKPDVNFTWVPGHGTSYPIGSVIAGQVADGQRTLVCAGINLGDGSVHPGYIADENCVYALDGAAKIAENYLVLVSDDPAVTRTAEAQPSVEGFDPGAILAVSGVARLCGLAEGLCVPPVPH